MLLLWMLTIVLLHYSVVFVGAAEYPSDLPWFDEILTQFRLHCPATSGPTVIRREKLRGITVPNHYFLGEDEETLVLQMSKPEGGRCELRHNSNWSTESTSTAPQIFRARIRVNPTNVKQLNIMQIHSSVFLGYRGGPPLMLKWRRDMAQKRDHLWATIRTNLDEDIKKNEKFDLGPRPTGFFDLEVRVQDMMLLIWINGDLKFTYDWDFLRLPANYFKTGVYGIDGGNDPQKIEYKALQIGPLLEDMPTRPPTAGDSPLTPTLSPINVFPTTTSSSFRVTKFVLVNAATNQDIFDLDDSQTNVIDNKSSPPLSIRAETIGSVGSVLFKVNGRVTQTENNLPYAINGDRKGDYNPWIVDDGEYTIMATPFSRSQGRGTEGGSLVTAVIFMTPTTPPTKSPTDLPDDPDMPLAVTKFILVDTQTNQDLFELDKEGLNVLDTNELPPFSMRVETNRPPGSVWFWVDGKLTTKENLFPYSISADNDGVLYEWNIDAGEHTIRATPFTKKLGKGERGESLTISIDILSSSRTSTFDQQNSNQVDTLPGAMVVEEFILVDTRNRKNLYALDSNMMNEIYMDELPEFCIVAEATGPIGSVRFFVDGQTEFTHSTVPYSIAGKKDNQLEPWQVTEGIYEVTATPFAEKKAGGKRGESLTVMVSVLASRDVDKADFPDRSSDMFAESVPESAPGFSVTRFVLVNTETNEDLYELENDQANILESRNLPRFTLRVETLGSPGGVQFWLDGQRFARQSRPPFSVAGGPAGWLRPWTINPGNYEITATPFAQAKGKGPEGESLTILVTII